MNNNYMNGEYIVSYDKNKTWISDIDGLHIFNKKTNNNEVDNLKLASKIFEEHSILIDDVSYKFYVPSIISWDGENNLLQLEYCDGINLEFILRNRNTHEKGVSILNSILELLIENKIYWSDFAPRNIILAENKICVVDFEKGFMVADSNLTDVFRNHIYEEYCLFLLPDERKKYVDGVFDINGENDYIMELDSVKPERIREIAKLLGHKEVLYRRDYLKIYKMILDVEEPYVDNGQYIYPGVILDKYMVNNISDNPVHDYATEVLKMYNSRKHC